MSELHGIKYRINANPSCGVTFFVKGAQNVQFSFAFFLIMSETLKAHISETEADIKKLFLLIFNGLSY